MKRNIRGTLLLLCGLAVTNSALAVLMPEQLTVATLPATPDPHWVWVNDIAPFNAGDGRPYLIDGDTGRMLGMVSGGAFHDALAIPSGYKEFYSTDTFYSRGTRGERTDVISIYDPQTLAPVGEIVLPPKQLLAIPTVVTMGLSDDNRFLAQYNFTPAQSVSIADLEARKFVGEVDTPGCGFVYPSGARQFQMICADGSLLTVRLDDDGNAAAKNRSPQLFDPAQELLNEDAVRVGNRWYLVSYKGKVFSFDGSGVTPVFDDAWSLVTDQEYKEGWRPGGYQLFAIHAKTGRLYVSMHVGGPGSHKNPGKEIWVFDINSMNRLQRIEAQYPVTSLQVTQDDAPLLFTVNIERSALEVYDARSGAHLRTIHDLGAASPTVLQIPFTDTQ